MKLIAPCFDIYAGQKEEHALLAAALAGQGVEYFSWQAEAGKTPEGDGIFWQGVSGYHQRLDRFEVLLREAEEREMRSLNPVALVRWNLSKTYLRELENSGIPVLPTLWQEEFDAGEIRARARDAGMWELVVKPVISAGAHLTYRAGVDDEALWEKMAEDYQRAGRIAVMIQPFAPEILEGGELSFIFFGQEFSHLVRKKPKAGDYRIQHVHGGSYLRETPSDGLLRQARSVLEVLPERTVYARVDGIDREGKLLLMEVELIEPYFYLDAAPEQAELFARAVMEVL